MFRFGQTLVQLEGDPVLCNVLKAAWSRFGCEAGTEPGQVVLRLEETVFPEWEPRADGWYPSGAASDGRVIYCTEGKPVFSLTWDPLQEGMPVRVGVSDQRRAGLGAQFGLLLALHKQCIGLHGVTLLCGDEIIVLSAPSGTGKTTLSRLLEEFCGAIVINGDFAMLSVSPEGVLFEPTPFCGSSRRCLNHIVRVNRVVFLSQSKENTWQVLSGREAIQRFMSNTFVPTWDGAMSRAVQETILKAVSALKTNSFAFAPTREAAELFSSQLESIEGTKTHQEV